MVSVFVRRMLVQLETPDAIRGRVSAVNSMFIGASNELGEFERESGRVVRHRAVVVLGQLCDADRRGQLHGSFPTAQARSLPRTAVHWKCRQSDESHPVSVRLAYWIYSLTCTEIQFAHGRPNQRTGALSQPPGRFDKLTQTLEHDGWYQEEPPNQLETVVLPSPRARSSAATIRRTSASASRSIRTEAASMDAFIAYQATRPF